MTFFRYGLFLSMSGFAFVAAGCSGGGGGGAPGPVATTPVVTPGTTSPATSVPTATPANPTPTAPAATPLPGTSSPPTPPATLAPTYAKLASDLTQYANAVNAQCPTNPAAATRFDVDLLQANASFLVNVLPQMTVAQAREMASRAVAYAVEERAALPGIGVMINPTYPVMVANPANAPSWWPAATDYPIFAAYYSALAQGLAQNGVPYDVEINLVFPAYSGQNYSTVSISQLEAGVAEDGSNVLSVMSPLTANIASEPLTLSQNTGQPSFDTTSGYASYATAVRSALVVPANSTTKIGAGSADWSEPGFLTAIEGVPDLDFYDEHLYPPDVLTTAGGGVAQIDAIDPAVSGKPGIMTETWDEKDAGDAGNYSSGNAQALESLDSYSFWAPLDAEYITSTMQLARCRNLSLVSFWYQYEMFAYLDYGSASALSASAVQSAVATAAEQSLTTGTLSPAGQAFYAGLTGHAPPSSALRRPEFAHP